MQASADAITASLNDLVARTQKVTEETILDARAEEGSAFLLTWASLAAAMGMDTFSLGNFLLSGIGSCVGVYVGWKVAQKLD